jgi:hypothetical protein
MGFHRSVSRNKGLKGGRVRPWDATAKVTLIRALLNELATLRFLHWATFQDLSSRGQT